MVVDTVVYLLHLNTRNNWATIWPRAAKGLGLGTFQPVLDPLVQPSFELVFLGDVLARNVAPLARAVGAAHRILNRAHDIEPNAAVSFIPQGDVVFVASDLRYRQRDVHFPRPCDIIGLDDAVSLVRADDGDMVVVQGVKRGLP